MSSISQFFFLHASSYGVAEFTLRSQRLLRIDQHCLYPRYLGHTVDFGHFVFVLHLPEFLGTNRATLCSLALDYLRQFPQVFDGLLPSSEGIDEERLCIEQVSLGFRPVTAVIVRACLSASQRISVELIMPPGCTRVGMMVGPVA